MQMNVISESLLLGKVKNVFPISTTTWRKNVVTFINAAYNVVGKLLHVILIKTAKCHRTPKIAPHTTFYIGMCHTIPVNPYVGDNWDVIYSDSDSDW